MNDAPHAWIKTASDRELVDALCDIESGIRSAEFVESIASWVIDKGRPMTLKQRAAAEKIMREHDR